MKKVAIILVVTIISTCVIFAGIDIIKELPVPESGSLAVLALAVTAFLYISVKRLSKT